LIKTHDLYALIEQCKTYNQQFSQITDLANELTDYETFTRYPAFEAITEDDMQQALQSAKSLLEFVKNQLVNLKSI